MPADVDFVVCWIVFSKKQESSTTNAQKCEEKTRKWIKILLFFATEKETEMKNKTKKWI